MDRIRHFFVSRRTYDPVDVHEVDRPDAEVRSPSGGKNRVTPPFSRYQYSVFLLLGVSMLWAWYVIY